MFENSNQNESGTSSIIILVLFFSLLFLAMCVCGNSYRKTRNIHRRAMERMEQMNDNQENKIKVVYYSSDMCGFCQRFNPTWEKLRARNSGKYIFRKITKQEHPEKIQTANIRGFPTIRVFFPNSNNFVDYNGNRELNDMNIWLDSL